VYDIKKTFLDMTAMQKVKERVRLVGKLDFSGALKVFLCAPCRGTVELGEKLQEK